MSMKSKNNQTVHCSVLNIHYPNKLARPPFGRNINTVWFRFEPKRYGTNLRNYSEVVERAGSHVSWRGRDGVRL